MRRLLVITAVLVLSLLDVRSSYAWPTNGFRSIEKMTNSSLQELANFARTIPAIMRVETFVIEHRKSKRANGGVDVTNIEVVEDSVLHALASDAEEGVNLGSKPLPSQGEGLQEALYHFKLHANFSDDDSNKIDLGLTDLARAAITQSSRVQLMAGEAAGFHRVYGVLAFYDDANNQILILVTQSRVYDSSYQ